MQEKVVEKCDIEDASGCPTSPINFHLLCPVWQEQLTELTVVLTELELQGNVFKTKT